MLDAHASRSARGADRGGGVTAAGSAARSRSRL